MDGEWCGSSQTWSLELSPAPADFLPRVDHIIYATGAAPNIEKVACMQEMMAKYPVPAINGLPRLTDDLMWHEDVPLFVTGGLAGLRLGPGAANLAGGRQGAERIAWKVEELLDKGQNSPIKMHGPGLGDLDGGRHERSGRGFTVEDRSEYTGGFVNQFQALAVEDD